MSLCLVTGGAGFIGSHIVDRLILEGYEVVVIDNLSTGNTFNLNPKAIFFKQDICNDLTYIFDQYKFDYVFHLAAQINLRDSIKNPQNDAKINILGSLNLIEQCVRTDVKKFIFSSTGGAIYSPEESLPFTEHSEAKPESPYGISKLTVENYLRFFKKVHGLESVVLRYSNVYGPRQNAHGEAGVVAIFVEKALANKDLIVFGDGEATRDFLFVSDVVDANILAMNQLHGTFNVSTKIQISVNYIIEKIKQLTNTKSEIKYTDAIVGEIKDSCLSYDKIKSYGWEPKWGFEKGLEETIKFFKKR